jgi:hypothetical protein
MEDNYELFDYVLTVNAGEVSATETELLGIGYNPVATAIIVTNDGGKVIVGYGMQTKMIALGFALAYMTQGSTVACTATTAIISGYNTLVPKNMARAPGAAYIKTISTVADCATTTTWANLASPSAAGANCMAFTCVGVSQPYFGIAEDWANDDAANQAYYIVGAIEYSG